MGWKTDLRIRELNEQYLRAKENGELGTAIRLLTRRMRLEDGKPEDPDSEDTTLTE